MNVFRLGPDTWIAHDLADVLELYEEHHGHRYEDEHVPTAEEALARVERVLPDERITIGFETLGDEVTLTAREWAIIYDERRLLGSEES